MLQIRIFNIVPNQIERTKQHITFILLIVINNKRIPVCPRKREVSILFTRLGRFHYPEVTIPCYEVYFSTEVSPFFRVVLFNKCPERNPNIGHNAFALPALRMRLYDSDLPDLRPQISPDLFRAQLQRSCMQGQSKQH